MAKKKQTKAGGKTVPSFRRRVPPPPRNWPVRELAALENTSPEVLAGCRTHYGWTDDTLLTRSEYAEKIRLWLGLKA